jgi:hypothetical protein
MNDMDDTVNLCPLPRPQTADETLVLVNGDSLPDLTIPHLSDRSATKPNSLWQRLLDAFVRAMTPWPV